MKIWYFAGNTLLVEYEGRPYQVTLDSDEPPRLLDSVPDDSVESAFERFMKFSFTGWYYGRVIPKPKTTAKRVDKIFDTWKITDQESN